MRCPIITLKRTKYFTNLTEYFYLRETKFNRELLGAESKDRLEEIFLRSKNYSDKNIFIVSDNTEWLHKLKIQKEFKLSENDNETIEYKLVDKINRNNKAFSIECNNYQDVLDCAEWLSMNANENNFKIYTFFQEDKEDKIIRLLKQIDKKLS